MCGTSVPQVPYKLPGCDTPTPHKVLGKISSVMRQFLLAPPGDAGGFFFTYPPLPSSLYCLLPTAYCLLPLLPTAYLSAITDESGLKSRRPRSCWRLRISCPI